LFYLFYIIIFFLSPSFFFFYCYRDLPDLHSFPTRRSSDLTSARRCRPMASPTVKCADAHVGSPAYRRTRSNRCVTSSINELPARSEEHTSELQSRSDLVCRLLLEKKKKKKKKKKKYKTEKN